jgi:hypothetical protein
MVAPIPQTGASAVDSIAVIRNLDADIKKRLQLAPRNTRKFERIDGLELVDPRAA